MPRERPLQLDDYGISHARYMELKYFCLQYPDKLQKIDDLTCLKSPRISDMPHGTETSDPTFNAVVKIDQLLRDTHDIEQAAIEAAMMVWPDGVGMYEYLINHVSGVRFSDLGCPCGYRQFRDAKEMFYRILSERRYR